VQTNDITSSLLHVYALFIFHYILSVISQIVCNILRNHKFQDAAIGITQVAVLYTDLLRKYFITFNK